MIVIVFPETQKAFFRYLLGGEIVTRIFSSVDNGSVIGASSAPVAVPHTLATSICLCIGGSTDRGGCSILFLEINTLRLHEGQVA